MTRAPMNGPIGTDERKETAGAVVAAAGRE